MTKEKDKKRDSVSEAIQGKFLDERKIFLWGEVSDRSARDLTEKLLFLEAENPGKEITFYINSPGVQLQLVWQYLTPCNLLAPHSRCSYWNGCEHGIHTSLWSNKGRSVSYTLILGF